MSHQYDAAGQELVLESHRADGPGVGIYTATYEAAGNRRSVLELDGARVTYGYNSADQLTAEQRSGSRAYNLPYEYELEQMVPRNDDPTNNSLTPSREAKEPGRFPSFSEEEQRAIRVARHKFGRWRKGEQAKNPSHCAMCWKQLRALEQRRFPGTGNDLEGSTFNECEDCLREFGTRMLLDETEHPGNRLSACRTLLLLTLPNPAKLPDIQPIVRHLEEWGQNRAYLAGVLWTIKYICLHEEAWKTARTEIRRFLRWHSRKYPHPLHTSLRTARNCRMEVLSIEQYWFGPPSNT